MDKCLASILNGKKKNHYPLVVVSCSWPGTDSCKDMPGTSAWVTGGIKGCQDHCKATSGCVGATMKTGLTEGNCFPKYEHNTCLSNCGEWTYVPVECKGQHFDISLKLFTYNSDTTMKFQKWATIVNKLFYSYIEYTAWSAWSSCSHSCGLGLRQSNRSCKGEDCPLQSETREEQCNLGICPSK